MYYSESSLSLAERLSSLLLAIAIPAFALFAFLSIQIISRTGSKASQTLVSFAVQTPRQERSASHADKAPPSKSTNRSKQADTRNSKASASRPAENSHIATAKPKTALPSPVTISVDATPLASPAMPRLPGKVPEPRTIGSAPQGNADQKASRSIASRSGHSDTYGQLVYRKIRRKQRYEHILRRQNIAGTVVVGFTVDSRGQLRAAHISRTSGYSVLDRTGLRHLAAAAPFPHPPQRIPRNFEIPLTYKQRP
ncbi:TonB family protein [Altericroceibacterium spongiae]|uniref:TonB family protein n=2 Tax=Altericroceibacterium spongiae TaxID=2320269 RepID=A0A420EFK9_9SPHN|nr:TonB family protein [Altericroceibacterium spongiae]